MNKQTAKFISAITQALPDVPSDVMQQLIESPERLKRYLAFLVDPVSLAAERMISNTPYLRIFTETITLAPTGGEKMIVEASDVFSCHIDPDFKLRGTDKVGHDTDQTVVDIYEVSKAGDYQALVGSLSTDPRSLALSQGQIIEFAQYRRLLRLWPKRLATFFLFEVEGELFVAIVDEYHSRLRVWINRFDHYDVPDDYYDCFRLVVPRQFI